MKEKLKALLSIVGILALAVGGSALLSRWFGTVTVQTGGQQAIELATGETKIDARTYLSIQHGFSLRLPPGYDLTESATGADLAPTGGGPTVMTILVAATKPKITPAGGIVYTDGKRFFILAPQGDWPPFQDTAQSFKAVIQSQ